MWILASIMCHSIARDECSSWRNIYPIGGTFLRYRCRIQMMGELIQYLNVYHILVTAVGDMRLTPIDFSRQAQLSRSLSTRRRFYLRSKAVTSRRRCDGHAWCGDAKGRRATERIRWLLRREENICPFNQLVKLCETRSAVQPSLLRLLRN